MPGLLTLMLPGVLAAAPVASVGNGGSATWSAPDPTEGRIAWRAPAPAWSNAGPVVVGDLVCATAEPSLLWCVDARTGAPRWQAEVHYGHTLPATARPDWEARRARAAQAAAEFTTLQASYSALRRELRRDPTQATLQQRLHDTARRLAEAQAASRVPDLHDARGERDLIGWSSHPPTSDGERLYAQFGQGVVAAFSLGGERLWTVFTEDPPTPMRGYPHGTAAAPLLVEGMLIVSHGHLRALDPATGRTLWTGPAHADFAAPAVVRLAEGAALLTPAGELVRARDGLRLREGLPSAWFTGWHVEGAEAWIVGGRIADTASAGEVASASALRITGTVAQPVVATAWSTVVGPNLRFYTPPVKLGGALWASEGQGELWRVDLATGRPDRVTQAMLGAGYTAVQVASGRLVWAGEGGRLASWDPAQGTLRTLEVGALRSTPVAMGRRWYVRTLEALVCVEVP